MIFTTRPIQRRLVRPSSPVEAFIEHELKDKGADAYKRENYFVRMIGYDISQGNYLKMIRKLDACLSKKQGYMRIEGMDRQFNAGEIQSAVKLYEKLQQKKGAPLKEIFEIPFPLTFKNKMMELTQKCAFYQVMSLFEESQKFKNETIIKNFGVVLIGLITRYLPGIFSADELIIGKIVYQGSLKRQELFFLYYLSLMGCDILYLNPLEDIIEEYPECQKFSTLYELPYKDKISFPPSLNKQRVKAAQQQEHGSLQRQAAAVVPAVLPPQKVPAVHEKGSIHLGPPNRNKQTAPVKQNGQKAESAIPKAILDQRRKPAENTKAFHEKRKAAPVNKKENQRELSYEELATLSTSIVMIGVYDHNGNRVGSGSGVVINRQGYILTNHHVVRHGTSYVVKFENDPADYETERIIKYHPQMDLAMIKVEKSCSPIGVYEGSRLVRGQKVVAIGSPLGLFNSVSEGIVSAFRQMDDGKVMIQFTAPISPGSSGGALLDLYGRLIGICTAGFDEGQNLNLAVSSECIWQFAGNYIAK